MKRSELFNSLQRKQDEIAEQLKQITIDILKEHGAADEDSAYCFEDARPCIYLSSLSMEVTVDKIWYDEENGLFAILSPSNSFQGPWTQNFEEMPDRPDYGSILWFMGADQDQTECN